MRWWAALAWFLGGAAFALAHVAAAIAWTDLVLALDAPATLWASSRHAFWLPGATTLLVAAATWGGRPRLAFGTGAVLASTAAVFLWPREGCPPGTFCERPFAPEPLAGFFTAAWGLYGLLLGALALGVRALLRRRAPG